MAANFSRISRINDFIHRELANLIAKDCQDPRIGLVTISSVLVSKDLHHAKVYVTVLETEKTAGTLLALNNAAGFLRSKIAGHLKLRTTPKFKFLFDDTLAKNQRLSQLLDSGLAKA